MVSPNFFKDVFSTVGVPAQVQNPAHRGVRTRLGVEYDGDLTALGIKIVTKKWFWTRTTENPDLGACRT